MKFFVCYKENEFYITRIKAVAKRHYLNDEMFVAEIICDFNNCDIKYRLLCF